MHRVNYHEKYTKYKAKYIQLKNQNAIIIGGENDTDTDTNEFFDIVEFIENENFSTIEKDLLSSLNNQTYCDNILGKGLYGEVYVSQPGSTIDVITSSGKKIKMNIVVKKANEEGDFHIVTIDKKLYIYGYVNITLEAMILSYFNKLWYRKVSPHLPFMIGYSSCGSKNNTFVDKIVMERHGLLKNIEMTLEGYNEGPLFFLRDRNKNLTKWTNNLATLFHLIKYILVNKNDENEVELPNGKKCDIVKLIDYLTISYIHTHNLLQRNNIVPVDMHSENIFIHWLNKNSYLDDEYIGDIEYIYYEYDDKIIKIETHGILLKIGDVGSCIVIPKNDIMILGQAIDLEKNLHLVDQLIKPNYLIFNFLYTMKNLLPIYIYEKTVASKIWSMYPYNELVQIGLPIDYELLKNYLIPYELLDHFNKYSVSKIDKNKNNFVVKEY